MSYKPFQVSGNNGDFYLIKGFGTQIVGDDSTVLPAGFYRIDAIAETTGLPQKDATIINGKPYMVNDVIEAVTGTGAITPAVGDLLSPIELDADKVDVSSWNMSGTMDSEDVATFANTRYNKIKSKAYGLSDITGSISGINYINATDLPQWITNSFTSVLEQDVTGDKATRVNADNNTKLGFFVTNKDITNVEVPLCFYIIPFKIGSSEAGSDSNTATQAFSLDFGIAGDGDLNFAYYRLFNSEGLIKYLPAA